MVCEGGPTLNSHLLSAGLVDELWLTLNPKLAGGAAALTIVAGRELVEPVELEPMSVAEGDGDLFTRWRRCNRAAGRAGACTAGPCGTARVACYQWAASMASAPMQARRRARARAPPARTSPSSSSGT